MARDSAGTAEGSGAHVSPELEAQARERLADLYLLVQAQAGPADPRGLTESCRRLVTLAEALGDRKAQAHAWHHLGIAHSRLGDFEEAREAYSRAIELWIAVGDRASELRSRQGLVNAYELMGEPESALAQAQAVAGADSWFLRCTGRISIAAIRHLMGDYPGALTMIEDAEAVLATAPADPRETAYLQAYLAGNRANVHLDTGELAEALEASTQMSASAAIADSRSQGIEALINTGLCHLRMGDMADAWRCLTQARQAASLAGDRLREATANWALSEWYTGAGLCGHAVVHAEAARSLASSSHARFAQVQACLTLGAAHLEAHQPELAIEPLEAAIASARALRAVHQGTSGEVLLARVALHQGRSEEAAEALRDCLSRATALGALGLAADAQCALASALLRLGDARAAREEAVAATASAEQQGAVHTLWGASHVAAKAHAALRQTDLALGYFRTAVKTIEEMWWPLWRIGFAEVKDIKQSVVDLYVDYVRFATAAGCPDEVRRLLAMSPWPFLRERCERDGVLSVAFG